MTSDHTIIQAHRSLYSPKPAAGSDLGQKARFPVRISRRLLLIAAIGVSFCVIGCGKKETGSDSDKIQVVATVGMVADLVRVIGDDAVDVNQICGSGVDPHMYKPTRDDVQMIIGADIVFYCGLLLEGKMADVLEKDAQRKPVVAVTEELDPGILLKPSEFEGHFDPHVWNDVSAWLECAQVVCDALVELDPQGASGYQERTAAYRIELEKLHEYGKRVIASVPKENRVLITSHDAFNYFGRAYDLEVMGVQGLSTESEAGLQRINELVDVLVDRDIQAVFIESSVSRKNIDALIEGARSRGQTVVIGGELFSDAMGNEGSYEGTYFGMLDHNLTTVALALGGDVDPGGFAGKLAGQHDEGTSMGKETDDE